MAAIIERIVVATVLTLALAGPSLAVEVAPTCGNEIAINGAGAIKEERALQKAIEAWRGQAITTYGIFYGNEKVAISGAGKGVEKVRCARTLIGLVVCQVRGRPCIENKTEQAGEPPIDGYCRFKPQPCDPTVKWVQRRLNDKGFSIAEDGRPGEETKAAIRRYKVRHDLGFDSFIDDRLVDSLKV